jgi:hypothetical protein
VKTADALEADGIEIAFNLRPVAVRKSFAVDRDEPVPNEVAVGFGVAIKRIHAGRPKWWAKDREIAISPDSYCCVHSPKRVQ